MGLPKDIMEGVGIVLERAQALRTWASVSFLRVMVIILPLVICLVSAQYIYLNHLLTEAKKSSDQRMREATTLVKENGLKGALDTVMLCMDFPTKENPKLHEWYCEQAVMQYKQVSTQWPQERVNEVVTRLAYGAMKNDISHYLRTIELDNLMHSPASREEEVLTLLLNNTAIVF